VGGGLAASSFAKSMAERGAKVLILEQEKHFKDRVRGEYIVTWGVAEARELGILDLLRQACASELPWIEMGFGFRDLRVTTPQQLPGLSFSHPETGRFPLLLAHGCLPPHPRNPAMACSAWS